MNDLQQILTAQKEWSLATFGPGRMTEGILRHIELEGQEVRENPEDLSEYIDIIILAMDAYWRAGGKPEGIASAIMDKQRINRSRTYPKTSEDAPSEHVRDRLVKDCNSCRFEALEIDQFPCDVCVSSTTTMKLPSRWETK